MRPPLPYLALCLTATVTVAATSACREPEAASTTIGSPAPLGGVEEGNQLCANGADDDLDGYIDCLDRDCALTADACVGSESANVEGACANGADDDGDGFVDSADDGCHENTLELCTNGVDDDGNGYADCDEAACLLNCDVRLQLDCPAEGTETLCRDGQDNDSDGFTDCDDWSCQCFSLCTPCGPETPDGACDGGATCLDGVCVAVCSTDQPTGSCPEVDQVCRRGECVVPGPCSEEEPDGSCEEDGHRCVAGTCRSLAPVERPGALVISEVLPDVDLDDDSVPQEERTAEWFEVYNPGDEPIELRGVEFADDGSDSFVVTASLMIEPHAYAILGQSQDRALNGDVAVDYAYGNGMALANKADEIVARVGELEIDRVVYGNGTRLPFSAGVAAGLAPAHMDATANDTGSNWCAQRTPWQDNGAQKGTPGMENEPCDP